jgi:signal transduction histidine kinase
MWLALGILIAFSIHISAIADGRAGGIGRILYTTIPDVITWALVSPAIYRALYELVDGARRFTAAALLAAWSVIAIISSAVMSYLGAALYAGVMPTAARFIELYVAPPIGPTYQVMSLSVLLITLAAFGILLALRQRARARCDAVQVILRDAELEKRLAESRLQALQSRINPHFLLNSLNAIAGLVQSGRPDEAFDVVARLGTLLQSALRQGEMRDISLGEEFSFAERYAQLLAMRHGPRFCCHFTIPDALRGRRVPALIIQPLIENAVRHGMPAGQPLRVDVRAYEQGRSIVIEVEDDGLGLAPGATPTLPTGHGLANVAERLRLVFGEAAGLQLESHPPRGTLARLRFAA